jgi:hypothetical protein
VGETRASVDLSRSAPYSSDVDFLSARGADNHQANRKANRVAARLPGPNWLDKKLHCFILLDYPHYKAMQIS